MNDKLQKALGSFLAERRESEGGWAKVTDKDIEQLRKLCRLLIEAKCEADPDGDYPIEVTVVNRRTHQGIPYDPMPYHDSVTNDERLDVALYNLGIAMGDVRTTKDIRRHHQLEREQRLKAIEPRRKELEELVAVGKRSQFMKLVQELTKCDFYTAQDFLLEFELKLRFKEHLDG